MIGLWRGKREIAEQRWNLEDPGLSENNNNNNNGWEQLKDEQEARKARGVGNKKNSVRAGGLIIKKREGNLKGAELG